jgi:hypothetical protein
MLIEPQSPARDHSSHAVGEDHHGPANAGVIVVDVPVQLAAKPLDWLVRGPFIIGWVSGADVPACLSGVILIECVGDDVGGAGGVIDIEIEDNDVGCGPPMILKVADNPAPSVIAV